MDSCLSKIVKNFIEEAKDDDYRNPVSLKKSQKNKRTVFSPKGTFNGYSRPSRVTKTDLPFKRGVNRFGKKKVERKEEKKERKVKDPIKKYKISNKTSGMKTSRDKSPLNLSRGNNESSESSEKNVDYGGIDNYMASPNTKTLPKIKKPNSPDSDLKFTKRDPMAFKKANTYKRDQTPTFRSMIYFVKLISRRKSGRLWV